MPARGEVISWGLGMENIFKKNEGKKRIKAYHNGYQHNIYIYIYITGP